MIGLIFPSLLRTSKKNQEDYPDFKELLDSWSFRAFRAHKVKGLN